MASKWDKQQCPVCMQGILHDGVRPESVTYQWTVYKYGQRGAFCDKCDDGITFNDIHDDERWTAFRNAVDTRIAAEMEAIVERHHIPRNLVAFLVGGGKNGFKRYTTCETRPTAAVWNLMRAIDRHPGLIQELQEPVNMEGFIEGAGNAVPCATNPINSSS